VRNSSISLIDDDFRICDVDHLHLSFHGYRWIGDAVPVYGFTLLQLYPVLLKFSLRPLNLLACLLNDGTNIVQILL
jgi:hypothetical protein